jgi:hypothetical protein
VSSKLAWQAGDGGYTIPANLTPHCLYYKYMPYLCACWTSPGSGHTPAEATAAAEAFENCVCPSSTSIYWRLSRPKPGPGDHADASLDPPPPTHTQPCVGTLGVCLGWVSVCLSWKAPKRYLLLSYLCAAAHASPQTTTAQCWTNALAAVVVVTR